MKSLILLFSAIFVFGIVNAQNDLDKMSTKERIRIAETEKIEAATDAQFQQYMSKGHDLFSERHYLKAIRSYEKAAEARPYNVYPKVKIADIELSMKDTLEILRAAEKEEIKKEKPKPELPETAETEEKLPETPKETMDRLDKWEEKEREKLENRRENEKTEKEQAQPTPPKSGDVQTMSIEDYRIELAETFPRGITESVSEQGNKVITTRVVVHDGKGDEYKKVVHNWGGVFFFKNGDAVTERVWNQETVSEK
ncbi:MAG TPA: hypothetical protein VJ949_10410 [Cryomorphaceae bacterium]|nr:hypothetical protein [Cryomorphaceae bacterium]